MSTPRSEDLIAEARDWARNTGALFPHGARLVDRLADALEDAAGFRRAPAEHDVEYVREGVCLLCGAGVLSSGEHLDPERHAEWVAKVTSGAPAEPAGQGEWEYGIRSEYDEIPLTELWPTFDVAQARVSNIRGGRWVIIRRRKAGPWEPVPRGADDEQ